jgi:hypothetical protein
VSSRVPCGDYFWPAVVSLELIVYVFDIGEEMDADTFPVGLRVLAVDDDRVCLKILERQLKCCNYNSVYSCLLSRPISPIPL